MRHFVKILTAAAGAASLACTAHAGTSAGPAITIQATVVQTCGLSTGSSNVIDFGNYAGTALTSTATILATCTLSTPYHVWIDGGTSNNTAARTLSNGTDVLNYKLSETSGGADWGTTDATTQTRTGSGGQDTITIYASLPAGQNKPAGTYTDTVHTTISF